MIHRKTLAYGLAFDTPYRGWIARNATILPGNQVVFQLGEGARSQIMLLDMPTHKLGLITMGEGPALLLHPK